MVRSTIVRNWQLFLNLFVI